MRAQRLCRCCSRVEVSRFQLDTGAMKVEKDAGFFNFEKERGDDMRLALEAVSRVSMQAKQ